MESIGSAHKSSTFPNLSTEEVATKIILAAIIVLFIAVFFILLLHLYAKLYLWRVDTQQQAPPSPPSVTHHQRRRFLLLSGQTGLSNNGLTSTDLSSLPIIVLGKDTCKDGLECAVCLSELVNGDKARLLPLCRHSFHVECIDTWFKSHSTCPICRNTVLDLQQECTKQDIDITAPPPSQISSPGPSTDSSTFPTNVLVWGSQDQVSTGINNVGPQEEAVVLQVDDSSSSMRFNAEEEEAKTPMTTRLRSLKRFLSRDKRVACSGGSSSSAGVSVDP